MTGVLIKRGNLDTGRHIQRKADVKINTQGECHGKPEDWSDAPTSQGTPGATGSWERGTELFFPSIFRERV